jgi:putative DNA primase/helicase
MTRRAVQCDLDPQLEQPELRKYRQRPVKMVQENRGAYVAACLTICRAYILEGRPNKPDVQLSSFEDWSDTVRAALIWLGKADIIKSIETAREDDPDLIMLRDVLGTWASAIGTGYEKAATTAKAIALNAETDPANDGNLVHPDFHTAIQAIGGTGSYPVDAQKLGYWLRSKKNRIVGGLRFMTKRSAGGQSVWWIKVSSGTNPPPVTPMAATPAADSKDDNIPF